jgi:ABC-2 type transport system permease protein
MGYVNTIITRYAKENAAAPVTTAISAPDFRTRVWYNPDLRSRNYMVPGVIALITMLTCLIITSTSIVRERETGTMEQLMVTPIRRWN